MEKKRRHDKFKGALRKAVAYHGSVKKLALALNRNPSTIHRWARDDNMPATEPERIEKSTNGYVKACEF